MSRSRRASCRDDDDQNEATADDDDDGPEFGNTGRDLCEDEYDVEVNRLLLLMRWRLLVIACCSGLDWRRVVLGSDRRGMRSVGASGI